jgi:protein-tyrosine-phosphatase
MPGNVILFVCTANQCRSPMAEYLLRKKLGPDAQWEVGSAGTSAIDGSAASAAAVEAMAELGIDASTHASRRLTRELVNSACMIVPMTRMHKDMIVEEFPDAADRCFLMGGFVSSEDVEDVIDPVGMSVDVYRQTRDQIAAQLGHLIVFLQEYGICD